MTLPTYFISHGGGPWPYMPEMESANAMLARSLADIPRQLGGKPKAMLMVSAHWVSRNGFKVTTCAQPPMLYDYHGFPDHTYKVSYPAPGAPWLAQRVNQLLSDAHLPVEADEARGFDHGVFVPASIMYPDADVPITQLSIDSSYDPAFHLRLGRALAPLRKEGILIVGSGLSYHNLREIYAGGSEASAQFDAWLQHVMLDLSPHERENALTQWQNAPCARQAHPQEDHLIPLMVAAGAAGNEPATCVYHEKTAFANITVSSFRFGAASHD